MLISNGFQICFGHSTGTSVTLPITYEICNNVFLTLWTLNTATFTLTIFLYEVTLSSFKVSKRYNGNGSEGEKFYYATIGF